MKKDQELIVITKTYDLILWSCNHTSRFPRVPKIGSNTQGQASQLLAIMQAPLKPPGVVERLRPRANGQRLGGGERGETEGFVRRNCLVR